ncbi:hypothetical protein JCM14469_07980 [Desulfatiferula olefinivorans]
MKHHVITGNVRRTIVFLMMVMVLVEVMAVAALSEMSVPPLRGRVNDYGGMLSASTVRQLETDLSALEQSDSTQIVVLTVDSLDGEPIETFAIRVAEAWKIGQADTDNGAMLIVSKSDRKLRIEVGYGLEGRLTDLVSGQIIRNIVVPSFKQGDFDRGISDGVSAMIAAVRGEYQAPPSRTSSSDGSDPLVFGILAFIFLVSQLGRANRAVGTAAGGIMLPVIGAMFFNGGLGLLLLLFPLGLVAGLILSVLGAALGSHLPVSHGYRSGGGFSSGGGFGGFSGGGGGFGGGGASGGW